MIRLMEPRSRCLRSYSLVSCSEQGLACCWSRVKKGQDMPCAVSTIPMRVGRPFPASGNSSPQTSTFLIRTAGYKTGETLEPPTGCQIKERNRPFADMISKVLLSEELLRMWGYLTLWRVPTPSQSPFLASRISPLLTHVSS